MSLDIRLTAVRPTSVFDGNITHNLTTMAGAVSGDFYLAIWHPDVLRIKKAEDVIPFLEEGLEELKNNPELYKAYNPSNGWGKYETLVEFVEDYLNACKDNPDAEIGAFS